MSCLVTQLRSQIGKYALFGGRHARLIFGAIAPQSTGTYEAGAQRCERLSQNLNFNKIHDSWSFIHCVQLSKRSDPIY